MMQFEKGDLVKPKGVYSVTPGWVVGFHRAGIHPPWPDYVPEQVLVQHWGLQPAIYYEIEYLEKWDQANKAPAGE